jgi:hypothetical protein
MGPAWPVVPPLSPPPSEVPNRPVRVTSVDVEGVTAYPKAEIERLAAGLVGPAVPLPKIDAARQAILQRYRANGYVLTTVSANLDKDGRLATTTGDQTGTIALNGVGGSIIVEGQLSAVGAASGNKGGCDRGGGGRQCRHCRHRADHCSGKAGGGTVAIDTTLARAADTE